MATMRLKSLLFLTLALSLPCATVLTGQESGSSTGTVTQVQETNSQETLRYLQLQEQLHATRLALERERQEAEAAATRNAEAMAGRLQSIEQALASQRAQELDRIRNSNQTTLLVACTLAGAGFLAILLLAFSHWRALNRMGEIAASISGDHWADGRLALPPAAAGQGERLTLGSAEQSNSRLLNALERLEKRILELENRGTLKLTEGNNVAPSALPAPAQSDKEMTSRPAIQLESGNGPHAASQIPIELPSGTLEQKSKPASSVDSLLAKGDELLKNDHAEQALAHFEEALSLHPNDAEALVKKGTALERLRRLDEAIECYDRAIGADDSMTIAYLYKGGLFNRLERFSEALECYEKALHTQERSEQSAKSQAPNTKSG